MTIEGETISSLVKGRPAPPSVHKNHVRHIAILFHGLSGGGMESSMLRLAAGFVDRGHRVDLVIEDRDGEFADCIPDGVNVHEMGRNDFRHKDLWRYRQYLMRLGHPAWHLLLSRRLRGLRPIGRMVALPGIIAYLRRARPDAMLAAEPRYNLLASCARQLAGVKTRIVVSERVNPSRRVGHDGPWAHPEMHRFLRWGYESSDAITAVSSGVADDLAVVAAIPRARISTVYNPVVGPDLPFLAEQPVDHPWFVLGAPPVVLAAGRISPQKDFATLIRAFAAARRARHIRLVILGAEGLGCSDHFQDIRSLIAELGVGDDVDFPGFVANPFAYMARAAAFVLSSRYEGLPGVLIQALACGCPVVSTDCPSGPREVLDDGRFGPLVAVGDDVAMAAAILQTLDTPLPRTTLITRASAFSVDNAVDDYLRLLLGPAAAAPYASPAPLAIPAELA